MLNENEVLRIRIRSDVAVQVGGLPLDLTQGEADKIVRTLHAQAEQLVGASEGGSEETEGREG